MSTSLEHLHASVAARARVLDAATGEARAVLSRGKELHTQVAALSAEIATLERVTAVLTSLGEERQAAAYTTIETLVTTGLRTIFAEPGLSFHIVPASKNALGPSAGVDFAVTTDLASGPVTTSVLAARGGGLSAVVGFLLRVVVLLLGPASGPGPGAREHLLVLDETFAHLSAQYLPAMGAFLRQIVDRSGLQILLVTHQPEFKEYADLSYAFALVAGRTQVTTDVSGNEDV